MSHQKALGVALERSLEELSVQRAEIEAAYNRYLAPKGSHSLFLLSFFLFSSFFFFFSFLYLDCISLMFILRTPAAVSCSDCAEKN